MRQFLSIGFIIISCLPCLAENWPSFRGPNADGVATGGSLPATWNADNNVRWQAAIPGEGWSAPVVANGKVVVTTAVSTGQKDKDSAHRWEVHCFDAKTGDVLWKQVASEGKPRISTHRANTYASETPVTDGERIVAYFGMQGLYCYDFDGNPLWQKDLGAFEMRNGWGTSSSPAVHDGLVFVQVDNEQDSFLPLSILPMAKNSGERLVTKTRIGDLRLFGKTANAPSWLPWVVRFAPTHRRRVSYSGR